MIIQDKIKVKPNKKTETWFSNKGYVFNTGDVIEIKTCDLNTGSHIEIEVKCDVCGNNKKLSYQKYIKNIKNGDFYACCSKCAQEKVKITTKEKYGTEYYIQTDEYKERHKETCLERYGVEHHTKSEIIKEKTKKTYLEKYGVEYYTQTGECKEKYKNTCLEKYGVENLFQSEIHKEKSRKTMIKNYGVEYFSQSNYIPHSGMCSVSVKEKEMLDFINTNYDSIIKKSYRKIIEPLELDIYLPEINLGIEFNGLYWHSEKNKSNDYHRLKSDMCDDKGVELIHIWEDDWNNKCDIVKSFILNKLNKNKIIDSNVLVEISDNKVVKDFLEENDINGYIGSSVKIGLYNNNELVSILCFRKNNDNYELIRYCEKNYISVKNGLEKMFNYFINKYKKSVTINFDRSLGTFDIFFKIGFKYICKTQPSYYYIINKKRHHRLKFSKDILVNEGFDKNKTEHEIMLDRKIYRIYDAGNIKLNFNI